MSPHNCSILPGQFPVIRYASLDASLTRSFEGVCN